MDHILLAQVGMSPTAHAIYLLTTKPLETQISIMISLGFHLRQPLSKSPENPIPENKHLKDALIQTINYSDTDYGLPKLPKEVKNLITTLSSHLKHQTTIPPLLSQNLLNTPQDLARGRDALTDLWNSWTGTFSSESLASVRFLQAEHANLVKAWTPPPLPSQKQNETLQHDYSHCLDNFGSIDELKDALKLMPPSSCGGALGITREHLLHATDDILKWVLDITGEMFKGNLPSSMVKSVIHPLPKDEHRWRSITLLEPLLKLVNGTVGRRLLKILATHNLLDPAQHGFITNGNCEDPLTVVCGLYSHSRTKDAPPLYSTFLDCTEAFDSVQTPWLHVALEHLHAPPALHEWLSKILTGHHRVVKTAYCSSGADLANSPTVHLESGTPQGCPLSPVLWIIIHNLALIFTRSKFPESGYPLTSDPNSELIQAKAYADDTALFNKTFKSHQGSIQALSLVYSLYGVRLNAKKSFYSPPPHKPKQTLSVYALDTEGTFRKQPPTTLKQTESTRYLGVIFQRDFPEGAPGGYWTDHLEKLKTFHTRFRIQCQTTSPTLSVLKEGITTVLIPTVMWSLQLGLPLDEFLYDMRRDIASMALKSIGLSPPTSPSALNTLANLILCPSHLGGWGFPCPIEIRARRIAINTQAGLKSNLPEIKLLHTITASTPFPPDLTSIPPELHRRTYMAICNISARIIKPPNTLTPHLPKLDPQITQIIERNGRLHIPCDAYSFCAIPSQLIPPQPLNQSEWTIQLPPTLPDDPNPNTIATTIIGALHLLTNMPPTHSLTAIKPLTNLTPLPPPSGTYQKFPDQQPRLYRPTIPTDPPVVQIIARAPFSFDTPSTTEEHLLNWTPTIPRPISHQWYIYTDASVVQGMKTSHTEQYAIQHNTNTETKRNSLWFSNRLNTNPQLPWTEQLSHLNQFKRNQLLQTGEIQTKNGTSSMHVQLWIYYSAETIRDSGTKAPPDWYLCWGTLDQPNDSFKSITLYDMLAPNSDTSNGNSPNKAKKAKTSHPTARTTPGQSIFLRPGETTKFNLTDATPKPGTNHTLALAGDQPQCTTVIWWPTSSRAECNNKNPDPPPLPIINLPRYVQHHAKDAANCRHSLEGTTNNTPPPTTPHHTPSTPFQSLCNSHDLTLTSPKDSWDLITALSNDTYPAKDTSGGVGSWACALEFGLGWEYLRSQQPLLLRILAECKCPSPSNPSSREELCPQHGHQFSPSTWHNIVNNPQQDSDIWTNPPKPTSPTVFTCLCGFQTPSTQHLDLHIATTPDISLPHGLELKTPLRHGGAFILTEESGYVVKAGAMRLPPSGMPSPESTPAEITTLPFALLHSADSIPNDPQHKSSLTFGTDAKNIVTGWDTFNSPTTSSRHKVRHPLYHYFTDLKAAQEQLPQISDWNIQHSLREGKLPLDSPKRRLASNIANAIVNLGAQSVAQRGKLDENQLVQAIIGTPLVLSERPALFFRSSIIHNPIKVFQTIEGYQTLSSCLHTSKRFKPPHCIRTPILTLDNIINGEVFALTLQQCAPPGQNCITSDTLGRNIACITDFTMPMSTSQRKEIEKVMPGEFLDNTKSKVDQRCHHCSQPQQDTTFHFIHQCKAFQRHQALAVMHIAAQFANSGPNRWGCQHERTPPPLISDEHPLLRDLTSGFTSPPDQNLVRIQIEDINNNPKLIILSTVVERFHKQCRSATPFRDIILKIHQHLNKTPQASIARMIPDPILNELISWFDLKHQALCSPLTPSSTLNNDTDFPPSIYAPEISYIPQDIL